MAQKAPAAATHTENPSARIQFSNAVPDGKNIVEVELDDETVFCVRPGEMSEQLLAEWNEHMAHATRSGRWIRTPTDETPRSHPQG